MEYQILVLDYEVRHGYNSFNKTAKGNTMKKVFYSPGPYCNTDTYEIVDFGEFPPSNADMQEIGYEMAIAHYETYGSEPDEDDIEPEYDYAWYDLDDPEVQGHI